MACLGDFGLAALSYDDKLPTRSVARGSIRYMAPEIIDPEECGLERVVLTRQSDIYSLGMTIWEVRPKSAVTGVDILIANCQIFSGKPPFYELPRDPVVIRRVLQGVRPERPPASDTLGLSDKLWNLLEHCWHVQPQERPSMELIMQCAMDRRGASCSRPPTLTSGSTCTCDDVFASTPYGSHSPVCTSL